MENQTIFSKKETEKRAQIAFPQGIINLNEKLQIIENWQANLLSGKFLQAKEEELLSLFLFKIFGDVLDYEYQNPNFWSLNIEQKTKFDSTKSDGAIGFFKMKSKKDIEIDVRAVIELKNTRTSLDKPQNRKDFKGTPVEQAFMYANKTGVNCKWVIVSNFLEIRLYQSSDINKYEKFDLFSLTDTTEFRRFYYLLSKEQLIQLSIPSIIDNFLQNRLEKEKKIGQEFYAYYRYIREDFFYHLKKYNKNIDYLSLLQYAQTIIDRIVFVSVIKDYDLISYDVFNRLKKIAEDSWEKDGMELWRQLQKLFIALDEGFPPRIHQFNGGLFKQNDAINKLLIKDCFLNKLLRLTKYDFESDLSINILGHIFEQSITDIEKLKEDIAENRIIEREEDVSDITPENLIKKKGKRKQDGIFYTPENITKYIIEKSVGAWLTKQKDKIGISNIQETAVEETEKRQQIDLWTQYIEILKSIKILDPACGSGAFLTQTFDFLHKEWKITVSEINKLKGILPTVNKVGSLQLEINQDEEYSDWKIRKQIVSSNLFGVDINKESVEITKLGLWIKTANKKDSLASLDTNIKFGNSLIDNDITKYPFNWQTEFKEIFDKGGFDVIVGNPPYIVIKGGRFLSGYQYSKEEIEYIKKQYQSAQQQINTYTLFVEKSIELLSNQGYLSFIIPNTFLANEYSQKFRQLLLENTQIVDIYNVGAAFEDANVETLVLTLNHEKIGQTSIKISDNEFIIDLVEISKLTEDNKFIINIDNKALPIIKKIQTHSPLSQIAKVWRGLTTGNDKTYLVKNAVAPKHKKLLSGKEVQRYYYKPNKQYVYYDKELLDRARDERIFKLEEKLISKFVGNKLTFCYDNKQHYVVNTACITELTDHTVNLKYLLALLNSELLNFYFQTIFTDNRDTFPIMKSGNIEQLPVIVANEKIQTELAGKADSLIKNNEKLQSLKTAFLEITDSRLNIGKISTKLDNWYEMEWQAFDNLLVKAKIKIPTKELKEWREFFINEKKQILETVIKMQKTETEIDEIVYNLYSITDSEKKMIIKP